MFKSYRDCESLQSQNAFMSLLSIKDCDLRLDTIYQGNHAGDKGIHVGGSFSELIPLTTMFCGGFIHIDMKDPTATGSDIFVLSKGHGIAGMVSVFADQGFFDRSIFDNCRTYDSILNAHPGPILPGVHVATGPLGEGISTAVGFAMTQKIDGYGRTFCLMGDGELQEGNPWEAFMYAADQRLDNLCVIIDNNRGQNDNVEHLMMEMGDISTKLKSFGFEVVDVDGTSYSSVYSAFEHFANRAFGKPFAIVSHCRKGQGGFCKATSSHKTTMSDDLYEWEKWAQENNRKRCVRAFCQKYKELMSSQPEEAKKICTYAKEINLQIVFDGDEPMDVLRVLPEVKLGRVPKREKGLCYRKSDLPNPKPGESYQCSAIAEKVIAAMARDPMLVTLDSDMGLISGLHPGMMKHAMDRALNTGIAESNMAGVAEAFAARGYNVWASTFGIFYDWRVIRRITVSQQERMEVMGEEDGWLAEGHGLDLTMFATAADVDTTVNGATHFGIDDGNVMMQLPHIKLINVACPRMMVAVMEWIASGNKGLVMLRLTRPASTVIYPEDFTFEYGKGYIHGNENADTVVISSGRPIYEALEAQQKLAEQGVEIAVVDMPSFDEELLMRFTREGKRMVFCEQNNGILFSRYLDAVYKNKVKFDTEKIHALSTLAEDRTPRHLHSGSYSELRDVSKTGSEDIIRVIME